MSEYKPDISKLMTEVYSYEFPEVSTLLGEVSYNPAISGNDLPISEAGVLTQDCYGFEPPLELPEREDGTLDLDELNEVFVQRVRAVVEQQLPGLDTFENTYVGHGSSDLLAKIIMEGSAKGEIKQISVVEGEYEGYKAYADAIGLPVVVHNSLEDAPVEPEAGVVWFVSNPSAVEGDIISPEVFADFVAVGHEIVIDAAYVGLTEPVEIDVSAQNIIAVTTSPSKIFGVFRRRMTGVAYTRRPVASLYGSKWFKDAPAMLETLKLYEEIGIEDLQEKYRQVQEAVCESLTVEMGIEITPSDVLLLGQLAATEVTDPVLARKLEPFIRSGNYRFGLTKLIEDYVNLEEITNLEKELS